MRLDPILVLAIVSSLLSAAIIGLNLIFGWRVRRDLEKLSPYECGFNPFSESRHKFEIKFYLVALIFLILTLKSYTYFLLLKT
jgi:NADH-quinone oxidoreductase subunit A